MDPQVFLGALPLVQQQQQHQHLVVVVVVGVLSDPLLMLLVMLPSSSFAQDFLRAVLSIQESASEVLVGRDRLVLSLLTQFGLALLTLVCHDRAWEDEPCFVGPIGLQKVRAAPAHRASAFHTLERL